MIAYLSYSINIEEFNMVGNEKMAELALENAEVEGAEAKTEEAVPATKEVAEAVQESPIEVALVCPYAEDAAM